MIKISVIDSLLTIKQKEQLNTGSDNFYQIQFSFNSAWAGLEKHAIFYQISSTVKYELDIDDTGLVKIPSYIVEYDIPLYIGAYGEIEGELRISTNFATIPVNKGAYSDDFAHIPDISDDIVRTVDTKIKYIRENEDGDFEYRLEGDEEWKKVNNKALYQELEKQFTALTERLEQLEEEIANWTVGDYSIKLSLDKDYVLKLELINGDGEIVSEQTVDFPLESVVVNGSYDNATKSLILTLQNGETVDIPVSDLVEGLASTSDLENAANEVAQTLASIASDISNLQSKNDQQDTDIQTANSNAEEAKTLAQSAYEEATTASSTAQEAYSTANDALNLANTIEQQLDERIQSQLSGIESEISEVRESAQQASSNADNAQSLAQQAYDTVNSLEGSVNEALQQASNAESSAQEAKELAEEARSTAKGLESSVNEANSTANSALTYAQEAKSEAGNAKEIAEQAYELAQNAGQSLILIEISGEEVLSGTLSSETVTAVLMNMNYIRERSVMLLINNVYMVAVYSSFQDIEHNKVYAYARLTTEDSDKKITVTIDLSAYTGTISEEDYEQTSGGSSVGLMFNNLATIDPKTEKNFATYEAFNRKPVIGDTFTFITTYEKKTYLCYAEITDIVENLPPITYYIKYYVELSGGGANPIIASTAEEMTALLTAENGGKIVKYTGKDSTYSQDGYYLVEED